MNWNVTRKHLALVATLLLMTGCASVPMAPAEQDAASKTFAPPSADQAGLYVYRNSFVGQALKKTVYIDGVEIGETANKVYLHRLIGPGTHTLSTESEFGDNGLEFFAEAGQNHFFEQYIKMGFFVGGANLRAMSPEKGQEEVLKCREALGITAAPADASGTPPPPQP